MEGEDEGREGCGFLGRGFGMATRQAGRAATGAVSPIVVGREGGGAITLHCQQKF